MSNQIASNAQSYLHSRRKCTGSSHQCLYIYLPSTQDLTRQIQEPFRALTCARDVVELSQGPSLSSKGRSERKYIGRQGLEGLLYHSRWTMMTAMQAIAASPFQGTVSKTLDNLDERAHLILEAGATAARKSHPELGSHPSSVIIIV